MKTRKKKIDDSFSESALSYAYNGSKAYLFLGFGIHFKNGRNSDIHKSLRLEKKR